MARKLFLSLVACLLTGMLYAQTTEDVVYLTNGKILRGHIIEESADGQIKMKSTDESVHIIDAAGIRKRTQEVTQMETARQHRLKVLEEVTIPYGYFGGATISTFANDGISPNPRTGAHLGVFLERPLNGRLSIVPEIMVTMKGGAYDYKDAQYDVDELDPEDERYDDGHGVDTKTLFDIHRNDMLVYLHVPVLLEAKVDLPSGFLFAGAGPYASYGIFSHSFEMEQNPYNKKENPPFYYNVYHNYDFGLALRLGWQTGGELFFQAGFERSLFSIKPTQTYLPGETRFTVKNCAFMFSVGRRIK